MPVLGIDLGTTFSATAYLDPNGTPTTIPNAEGDLTTPSVVLFEKSGEIIVGREARRAALAEPGQVAECVKRYMGDDYFPQVINGRRLSPVEISALILLKLGQDAQKRIGKVEGVVITVPAYFDEARRQATAKAGALAGLNVLDIINEPTGAALAYAYRGFNKDFVPFSEGQKPPLEGPPSVVLVYDLGGGTFDVTILRIEGKKLSVLATAGDVRLGGRDWDDRLFKFMADQFLRENGEDPRENPISLQNLMLTAEETKKVLSSRKQAHYVINHAGRSFPGDITREQFDELTQDLLYRTENRLTRVIRQAKLTWEQVDQVLAVGGSTRMPQVLAMLQRVTGREANCSLSPDEAVAQGAAIHAAICATRPAPAQPKVARPVPTPPKLPPSAAMPARAHAQAPPAPAPEPPSPAEPEMAPGVISFFKQRVVEVLRSIRTTNVNAHSLGIVVTGHSQKQHVSVLIPHNTQLPVGVTKSFGTVRENQTSVTVKVVEGESSNPEECIQVGACSIARLPPGLPKGSPVEVTFKYDNSGRLHVQARETTSGKWASVAIQRHTGPMRNKNELVHGSPPIPIAQH